jgi:hypothetical protein
VGASCATIVNPGFFRTELLTEQSTNYAEPSIADDDERRAEQLEFWKAQNGQQSGDPAKLARARVAVAKEEPPPRRFIVGTAEQKIADLKAQIEAHREEGVHPFCPPGAGKRVVFSPLQSSLPHGFITRPFLLATTPVALCPRQSPKVTKPQKIFANETLYQLSYTPSTSSAAEP